MLQLSPHTRIFVCVKPVDFRKGIDGLAAHCKRVLSSDPFSGQLFLFTNRRRTAIKMLFYDSQGFWMCQKRLSEGRFNWWPKNEDGSKIALDIRELTVLLWNGNPKGAHFSPEWKNVEKEVYKKAMN